MSLLLHLERTLALGQVPTESLAPLHLQLQLPLQPQVLLLDVALLLGVSLHLLGVLLLADGECLSESRHLRAQRLDVGAEIGGGVAVVDVPGTRRVRYRLVQLDLEHALLRLQLVHALPELVHERFLLLFQSVLQFHLGQSDSKFNFFFLTSVALLSQILIKNELLHYHLVWQK
jgi:hypothetical protein